MEENKLDRLREEYEKITMPQEQVEKMKERIEKGKTRNKAKKKDFSCCKGRGCCRCSFCYLAKHIYGCGLCYEQHSGGRETGRSSNVPGLSI